MGTVGVLVAVALAVLLAVRERSARRALAALRAELHAMRADVRTHERLASVGQLVSGLAQDLKSPLQGVIGNAELALASRTLGTESTDDLREIQNQATRAAGIVRNLLAFTETTTLSRRWHDVNDLVDRAISSIRFDLDTSGVRVRFVPAEHLPLLYVDGRQLEKVIATLLLRPSPRSVARRETAAVTLATRRVARDGRDDRLVVEVDDRTAADTGDEAAWAGDLAACRQIAQAHGGSLEVKHSTGGGFQFHLELPVTAVGTGTAVAG
jgi:signal transduction histidine kinase